MGKPEQKPSKSRNLQNKFSKFKTGNSVKGQGFAQSRKRKCLKKYGKHFQKKESQNSKFTDGKLIKSKKIKSNDLLAAREKFKEEEKHRQLQKKEIEESKKIHQETVLKNIKKRKQINKQLSKRTKKGQPVMGNHIQYMLEKLKNT